MLNVIDNFSKKMYDPIRNLAVCSYHRATFRRSAPITPTRLEQRLAPSHKEESVTNL